MAKPHWILALTCLMLSVFMASPTCAADRTALVIGNGAYLSAPLRNPPNDAQDVASALRELGFEVIVRVNADEAAMEKAIERFYRDLRRSEVGLFFYAGHGMQLGRCNYLIPVDARISSEADVRFKAVEAEWVLGKMEDAGSRVNIVILDACRDNPFVRSIRSASRGLVRMRASKGSFIAYATEPGCVAVDGSGRNSPFTQSLLEHMRTSGLKIEDVIKRVRADVTLETNDKQLPWQSSSLVGDFYFNPGESVESNAALSEERKRIEAERRRLAEERARFEAERRKARAEQERLTSLRDRDHTPARPSPKTLGPVVARDRHFVAYASGVVRDTKTALEWKPGPDRDMTWFEARAWVRELNAGAGGGWRMPTMDELRTLYEVGRGSRNMTPLLKTTGWWVWSCETKDTAWYFGIHYGNRIWRFKERGENPRGFAVRSRGEG